MKGKALESKSMTLVESTKVNGLLTREVVTALSFIRMAIHIEESLRMERLMAKEFTFGRMEKYMKASGIKQLNMAQECGEDLKVTRTWANGKTIRFVDLVFIFGKMVINMKANFTMD